MPDRFERTERDNHGNSAALFEPSATAEDYQEATPAASQDWPEQRKISQARRRQYSTPTETKSNGGGRAGDASPATATASGKSARQKAKNHNGDDAKTAEGYPQSIDQHSFDQTWSHELDRPRNRSGPFDPRRLDLLEERAQRQ